MRAAVVGGGFIGSEIAAALTTNGCEVTIVFPEAGIGARLFPAELSAFVNEYYREKGVPSFRSRWSRRSRTTESRPRTGRRSTPTSSSRASASSRRPPSRRQLGCEVDDGILVDEYGKAGGREDVFAAGDVARFPVPVLGGTRRVEHEDHANTHGRTVGANMAGARTAYDHLPFFYSDLFDLGYEAVGDVDSRLETVEHWVEPGRKGVVFYVDDEGAARGALLWDVWGKVDDARELIVAGAKVAPDALLAFLD